MESITLYEVRVIEKNKIDRQFADTLDQLVSLIKKVEDKKFYAYKIYKSLEGNILSSEKLDCKIHRNNFIIKTVVSKPINVRYNQPVRRSIAISTFEITGTETSSPKILSHIFRKPNTFHTAPRHSRAIRPGSFGRNRKQRGLQLRSRGRVIRSALSSRKPLLRSRAAGLSLGKFRTQPRAFHSGGGASRMKTNKNLRSKVSRAGTTPSRANSRKNKSDSPYRRK